MNRPVVYYFDAERREMVEWSEGTPLNHVKTLRTVALGVAYAFNDEGYVVGLLSDNGQFQVLPPGSPRRHVSEFGTKVKLQPKPEMLDDLPEPGCLATLPLPLFVNGSYLLTASVRLLDTVMGRTVSVARKWRTPFDVAAWRRLLAGQKDLEVGDGSVAGLPGRKIVIRCVDLASMIFEFGKFEGKEQP